MLNAKQSRAAEVIRPMTPVFATYAIARVGLRLVFGHRFLGELRLALGTKLTTKTVAEEV